MQTQLLLPTASGQLLRHSLVTSTIIYLLYVLVCYRYTQAQKYAIESDNITCRLVSLYTLDEICSTIRTRFAGAIMTVACPATPPTHTHPNRGTATRTCALGSTTAPGRNSPAPLIPGARVSLLKFFLLQFPATKSI